MRQERQERQGKISMKPLRDTALIIAVLAMAATTSISINKEAPATVETAGTVQNSTVQAPPSHAVDTNRLVEDPEYPGAESQT